MTDLRGRTTGRSWSRAGMLACAAAMVVGCGRAERDVELHVEYGRQRGALHGDSINGTAVLARMFEQAGHRVSARSALSPAIEQADAIVWFPDDWDPPAVEVRRWFEDWLQSGYNRTLVYVGRDFDAEPLYWRKVIEKAPESARAKYLARLESAKVRVAGERQKHSGRKPIDAGWFKLNRDVKQRTPNDVDGEWSESIDATKTEIELGDRVVHFEGDERLFYNDDSAIVIRVNRGDFDEGQILAVQNGSFLLNLPLVNHEHRRLAARLIDEVEETSGRECSVVFLESGEEGPAIHEHDPRIQPPTEADYPPPISDMLYHGIALAIVVTLGSWPIFGRARRLASPPLSDFGRHVESLGDLLRRSRDDGYCRERVLQWQGRERR